MLHTLHDNIHLSDIIKGGNYNEITVITTITYSSLLPTTIPTILNICNHHQTLSTNRHRIHPRTNHRDRREKEMKIGDTVRIKSLKEILELDNFSYEPYAQHFNPCVIEYIEEGYALIRMTPLEQQYLEAIGIISKIDSVQGITVTVGRRTVTWLTEEMLEKLE